MNYQSFHWSLVNVMARLFGLMAALVGSAFGVTAMVQFSGTSISTPGVSPLGNLVVSVICLVIAVGFLTVRPYRPDLEQRRETCDDGSLVKVGWWTGAPRR